MFSFTSSEISAERRRLYRRVSTASRRWCCCCPLRNGEPLLDPPSPVESQSRENDSSPSWKLKRLRSSIDNGVHALGVGLGGAMPRITKFARTGSVRFKDVCSSPSDVCMWLGAAVSLPVLVLLNFNRAYAMHETIFKTDINSRTEALIRCACVPVACTAVNYFVQHLRRTVFFWEKRTEDRFFQQSVTRWIDPISIGLMLLAALFLIRNACCIILEDNVAQQVHFCFTGLMVMICAIFYFNMLDRINDVLHSMITDQEIINHSKPVEKMQNIVHNISRSGDTERDIVYSFSHTHTVPAKVLHYIWSIYYLIGKILGALVVLAFFAQVESETINRFLLGSLLISGAASGGFMLELGPSTISLLRLSLYKPFYVGDLVTLNKTGDMAMTEAVVGFVENITMMYVVIRNFEMKQVWISHKAFNELVIQNWTRRPTKTVLLNIGISTKAPKAKVQSLQEFGKKWIKGSPDIQQNNYQKCHITSTSNGRIVAGEGNGYNLEIIFFPMVGVSHRQIRQKFLMSFMSAAERLLRGCVPLQLMQNFCEDCELGNVEAMSVAAHAAKEVALDDLLPDPDDLLERGKE